MSSRALSYFAIGVFALFGTLLMATRYHARQSAQLALEESVWRLDYDIHVETFNSDDEVLVALPFETPYCQILSDSTIHPGLRAELHGPYVSTGTREWWISARHPEKYNFKASFTLQLSPRPNMSRTRPLESLTLDQRARYLRSEENIPTTSKEVLDAALKVPDEGSEAQRVQYLFEYCAGIDSSGDFDTVKEALEAGKGTPLAKARAMVTLCRAIKIPARLVTGFEIKQGVSVKPHVWVEVFQTQSWEPYDPEHGYSFTMPAQFVPVRRNGDQIIKLGKDSKATVSPVTYSILRIEPPASVLESEERHPIQIFNLQRLPVPMHEVITILLLLPLAALITSVMRNVVGIRCFGTFAPALLAMSFIYANLETGLAILTVVVALGLISRTFLERLRLLMVPRLSVMLTVVILCVVFGVSLLDYLDLTPSPQAVLLPMVILTLLIERFYVTTEEDGLVFTLQLAAGTLFISALCYLMLAWEDIGEFILVYPEAHFLTLAVFILVGRYAGYRITELWRFRELVVPSETQS